MTDIAVEVRRVLTNMGVEYISIADESTLVGDLDLDSIELTEFALLLEEAFNIEIPDGDLSANMTVAEVCAAVDKLKGVV